jgi:hypothetical protein
MATVELSMTLATSAGSTRGLGLDVDLGGVERTGVTDRDDRPLFPGEKVDRYRFASFYLDGSTAAFHHFFDEVVDPVWLMSNREEARALRSIDRSRPGKPWRVLHRVTSVERPTLGALERSRPAAPLPATGSTSDVSDVSAAVLTARVAGLERQLATLTQHIDELHTSVTAQLAAAGGGTVTHAPDDRPPAEPIAPPAPTPAPTPEPEPVSAPDPPAPATPATGALPRFEPGSGLWGLWPANADKPRLRRGAQGDAVRYVQGVIQHRAGGAIVIDGSFGVATERRVLDLQRFFRIAADGVVGDETWGVIDYLAGT